MTSFITHMMSIWNVVALLIVLAMTFVGLMRRKSLPEELPGKYDIDGRPNTWAQRRVVLWYYPILTLALIVFLAATDGEKAAPLSLFFATALFCQMLRTFAIADGRADRLPPWFMPALTFGVILVALLVCLI